MTNEAVAQEVEQPTIQSLDSVLEGESAEESKESEVEGKTNETQSEETKTTEAEGEKPEDEESGESEPPSETKEDVGLKAALAAERQKRQDAEKQLEELQPKQEDNVPDPVEDPEGYSAYMEDKANQAALNTKINLSRDMMLSLDAYKEDFEEVEQHFMELIKTNPILIAQMNASPNPAKFAYDKAKDDLEIQKLRDPKYRENLKAELRKELEAEEGKGETTQEADDAEKPEVAAAQVPDLTNAAATGSNTKPKETLKTLDDVLPD